MAIINSLCIEDFYLPGEMATVKNVILPLMGWEKVRYGEKAQNFNLIPPNADETFTQILGIAVTVDQDNSGSFYKPEFEIHFEPYSSPREWIFAVCVEDTFLNIFHHKTGAKSALQGCDFDYINFSEWDIATSHKFETGQGIFFRPWMFHSFIGGMLQFYRLKELY